MQLDPAVFDDYGEMAFLIGTALKADISILSLYSAQYTKMAQDYLVQLCKYKLSAPVKMINIACTDMVYSQSTLDSYLATIQADFIKREVLPATYKDDINIYAALDACEMDHLAQDIEQKLLNNI